MTNYCYSILRIGPILHNDDDDDDNSITNFHKESHNPAILLRDAIRDHFHKSPIDANDDANHNNNNNNDNHPQLLFISNRYFHANVLLLELDEQLYCNNNDIHKNNIDDENNCNYQKFTPKYTSMEDGVILIFNDNDDDDESITIPGRRTTTFASLDEIHSKIVVPRRLYDLNPKNIECDTTTSSTTTTTTTMMEGVGDLLRLCIGISSTPKKQNSTTTIPEEEEKQHSYSQRVLWCLDHGYEYIQVDLSHDDWKTKGFHERDKDGYARVIEAIETCMWSSHVMKKKKTMTATATTTSAAMNTTEMMESDEIVIRKNDEEGGGEGVTPSSDTMTPNPTHNIRIDKSSNDDSLLQIEQSSLPALTSMKWQDHQHCRDQELAFHQLEQLLTEAKTIREASKSSDHTSMSDDERRERAGSTALKLMELLDHLGLDEDEDDEEFEEEDDA